MTTLPFIITARTSPAPKPAKPAPGLPLPALSNPRSSRGDEAHKSRSLPNRVAATPSSPGIAAVITAIQNSLTPDLLKPQYREVNATNPLFGHCYHSAEALYHLIRELQLPEEYHSFRPCRGVDDNGIPHWWLQNERGGILDPTAGQYTSKGVNPPYESGRFRPFLTRLSSKKTHALIMRIKTTRTHIL